MNEIEEEYYIDEEERSVEEYCPICREFLDDADFDFQICSICGWNGNEE